MKFQLVLNFISVQVYNLGDVYLFNMIGIFKGRTLLKGCQLTIDTLFQMIFIANVLLMKVFESIGVEM